MTMVSQVDPGTGTHCITMFEQASCPRSSRQFSFPNQNGQCTNVNTGTGILSFICAPSNICLTTFNVNGEYNRP